MLRVTYLSVTRHACVTKNAMNIGDVTLLRIKTKEMERKMQARDHLLHHKWRYRHTYNQTISLRKYLSIYFQ